MREEGRDSSIIWLQVLPLMRTILTDNGAFFAGNFTTQLRKVALLWVGEDGKGEKCRAGIARPGAV